jgi:lipoprotein-anchoring transpeptidase ErfK/SrfK
MAAALAPPPAAQPIALVTHAVRAHVRPAPASRTVFRVPATTPITGGRTALPVIGRRTDAAGRSWLHVQLPGRPNGHTGWVPRTSTRSSSTPWALRITLHTRTVSAYRGGRLVRRVRSVVGAPTTPTPRGRFFVEENVRMPAGAVGAPYALALSARSDVFQEFEGGPGQVALHGRDNVGGTLGTAASHGCIRLDDGDISWLARRLPAGTPVTIVR